jgi:putative acetyltransferase
MGAEFQGFYVSADHQREGIGSKLLAKMEESAASEGITEMVFQSTLTALAFYISQGYQENGKDAWPLADEISLQTVIVKKQLRKNA